jgi:hypothetical protein
LELEARMHYWRGLALGKQGDTAAASAERLSARQLVMQIQASLLEPYKNRFVSRASIRPLVE